MFERCFFMNVAHVILYHTLLYSVETHMQKPNFSPSAQGAVVVEEPKKAFMPTVRKFTKKFTMPKQQQLKRTAQPPAIDQEAADDSDEEDVQPFPSFMPPPPSAQQVSLTKDAIPDPRRPTVSPLGTSSSPSSSSPSQGKSSGSGTKKEVKFGPFTFFSSKKKSRRTKPVSRNIYGALASAGLGYYLYNNTEREWLRWSGLMMGSGAVGTATHAIMQRTGMFSAEDGGAMDPCNRQDELMSIIPTIAATAPITYYAYSTGWKKTAMFLGFSGAISTAALGAGMVSGNATRCPPPNDNK